MSRPGRPLRPLRLLAGATVATVAMLIAVVACTPFNAGERDTEINPPPTTKTDAGGGVADAKSDAGGGGAADGSITKENGAPDTRANEYRDVVIADTPIAYWRFNEKGGSIAHSLTTDATDATIVGVVGRGEPGLFSDDDAFGFGAHGALVETTSGQFAFTAKTNFTLEAWFFPTNVDAEYRHIFIKDGPSPREEYGVYFQNGGLAFERWVNNQPLKAILPVSTALLNQWHHVIAIYNGAQLTLYLDALMASTSDGRSSGTAPSMPFRIGAKLPSPNEYGELLGRIDEVAVYDYALAPGRVTAHFAAGKPF